MSTNQANASMFSWRHLPVREPPWSHFDKGCKAVGIARQPGIPTLGYSRGFFGMWRSGAGANQSQVRRLLKDIQQCDSQDRQQPCSDDLAGIGSLLC